MSATLMNKPRLLVTRPRQEAMELAAALEAKGCRVTCAPLLEIRWLADAAPRLRLLLASGPQALLVTSQNALRALNAFGVAVTVPVLAVGGATAEEARRLGITEVNAAEGTVASLATLAAQRLHPANGSLLYLSGTHVSADLCAMLRARGFQADRLAVYDALPAPSLSPGTADAIRSGGIDAALFFSARTTGVFLSLARKAALSDAMHRMTALCLSEAVARALRGENFRKVIVSREPNLASLLASVDNALSDIKNAP